MKRKAHILIFILTLGFFLIPASTYACGTKLEKSCCKKEVSSTTAKKDCCKDKQTKGQDKECGGKCGHSNCTSSISQLSLAVFNLIEFRTDLFNFTTKKQKFYHTKARISSGFYFVWLPPKIN
ncbi:MAG TPA: hypothetical protein VJL37_11590 [Flavobacterium sp.]|nr:hypothetical protein [Flavobacterium sp.]